MYPCVRKFISFAYDVCLHVEIASIARILCRINAAYILLIIIGLIIIYTRHFYQGSA
jgi:hypothetical protein